MPLPKRILISRLSAMGDVAMVVPVVIRLARAYPEVTIFLLSRKRFEAFFKDIPQVSFLEADVYGTHKGPVGLYRLSKEIKKLEIDAFADFHNVLRTKVVRNLLTGIKVSVIDKGRTDKKRLVNDASFFEPLKHTTDRYLNVLQELGFDLQLEKNEFLETKPLTPSIISFTGVKNEKWIGFAPFAAHKPKSLTTKRAKKLVKRISKQELAKVILIGGGEKEKKKLQIVAGTTPNVLNMAGEFTFEEELALISNLDAMIAMDSGNGHLASLFNVPVITLWGNTHPYGGFAPYAQPQENQLCVDRSFFPLIPTSIYGNKKLTGYVKAVNSIKSKRIIYRLKELLTI